MSERSQVSLIARSCAPGRSDGLFLAFSRGREVGWEQSACDISDDLAGVAGECDGDTIVAALVMRNLVA